MLEGLSGEYHSSSVALGNVLSCQSLLSRVLAGLLAYQVVVCKVQCSTSSGSRLTVTLTPFEIHCLAVKYSIHTKQGKLDLW